MFQHHALSPYALTCSLLTRGDALEPFGRPEAIRWVIACMFVALLTVTVVLAFNEGAVQAPLIKRQTNTSIQKITYVFTKQKMVQAILMVPLLVAVLLFWVYLEAEHFRTASGRSERS